VFLVGCCIWIIDRWLSKAMTFFFYLFFLSLSLPSQTMARRPPTRSVQVLCPPQYPSYRKRQLSIGCYVVQPKDGHLRPRPRPSLCFLMGCIFAPQTKYRRAARVHPMHPAIDGPIGSSGAKIWVHGGCCHGERGPKPLKGQVVAANVGCWVLW
jgi:hypothetical protein